MPTARRRLSPEDRRAELLALGAEVFGKRPYDEVRIDEIAERAGVSRALMYHYFPDKRAFFAAVVKDEADRLYEATNEPEPAGMTMFEEIRTGVLAYMAYHQQNPEAAWAAYVGLGRSDPVLLGIDDEAKNRQMEHIMTRIAEVVSGMEDNRALQPDVERDLRVIISAAGWRSPSRCAASESSTPRPTPTGSPTPVRTRCWTRSPGCRRFRTSWPARWPPRDSRASCRYRLARWSGERSSRFPAVRPVGPVQRDHPGVVRRAPSPRRPPRRREAWEAIADGDNTLVIAPTGSGKTLAAFLWAIDRSPAGGRPAAPDRPAGTRVLYVSPLKALAVDVERNLRTPLTGITRIAERRGRAATRHQRRGPLRRHPTRAAPRAHRQAARHPDHHPGVAVPDADLGRARNPGRRADGDRRRGARRRRRPSAARTWRCRWSGSTQLLAAARAAHRVVGDRASARGGGPVPVRAGPDDHRRAAGGQDRSTCRCRCRCPTWPTWRTTPSGPTSRRASST